MELNHCTGAQDCNAVTLSDSLNKLCWRKQAVGWKAALSEQSAVQFHECTCYILSQVTVQSTGCYWAVFFGTRPTDLKASYSSCWPPPPLHPDASPPKDDGEQLLRRGFGFYGTLILSWQRKVPARIVWIRQLSLLCDSWRDVSTECQSFLIWVGLKTLCTTGMFSGWPVSAGLLYYNCVFLSITAAFGGHFCHKAQSRCTCEGT